jgi:hypothetical protein
MADLFQTFLLIATFDIALISISIANYAVSVSYLGRENKLSRWRIERRKQRLSQKMRELQGRPLEIGNIQREINEAKKDLARLSDRTFAISWLGAVITPSICFISSFIFAIAGMNFDSLPLYVDIQTLFALSVGFLAFGFIVLMNVIRTIDSVAKEIPLPKLEVYFEDYGKSLKLKRKQEVVVAVTIHNTGEDMAEDVQVYVGFPPAFTVLENREEGYRIVLQGSVDDYPEYSAVILDIEKLHIDVRNPYGIALKTPDDKNTYEIPINICERKIGQTKDKLTIEVTD